MTRKHPREEAGKRAVSQSLELDIRGDGAECSVESAANSVLDTETLRELRSSAHAIERLWRDVTMTPAITPCSEGDSRRVTLLAMKIAQAMGLRREQVLRTMRAAYLRDVGILAVPESIILKPGKLTRKERAAMQVHPGVGYELLSAFLTTWDVAHIVLSHHECYDGSGYPNALLGAKIPVEARILTIADSLDAMTSIRPYRAPISYWAAQSEIVDWAGRQFDPNIVEDLVRTVWS